MADSFAIHVQWDQAGLSRFNRYLQTHEGRLLQRAIDQAIGKAVRPLGSLLKAAERGSGIKNRSGAHYRSINVHKPRKRAGEVAAYTAGPTDRKKHLLIRGHRIVTPGGRDTGRRSKPFPYVEPVIDRVAPVLMAQLQSDVWASNIRPF